MIAYDAIDRQDLFIVFLSSFALALFFTILVRRLAPYFGLVDRPRSGRSANNAIPLGGGIAILLTMTIQLGWYFPYGTVDEAFSDARFIACALLFQFILSLTDDLRTNGLHYFTRLIIEIGIAIALVTVGIRFQWDAFAPVSAIFTVLWIVGFTNSFNLLDNMDGQCGGIGIVSSICLTLGALAVGNVMAALPGIALVGSLIAFLMFNWRPATIYLGDAGSNFIGLSLAILSILLVANSGDQSLPLFVLALSAFAVPIYDTLSVIILRISQGKSPFKPDTQHLSHRFVRLGFSKAQAVTIIIGFAALVGGAGLLPISSRRPDLAIYSAVAMSILMVLLMLTEVTAHRIHAFKSRI